MGNVNDEYDIEGYICCSKKEKYCERFGEISFHFRSP
jgi:hypothetical protein